MPRCEYLPLNPHLSSCLRKLYPYNSGVRLETNPVGALGKTLSLHAGAHSTCASEPLHPEAPGYRGELPDDGEHPARATGAAVTSRTRSTPATPR